MIVELLGVLTPRIWLLLLLSVTLPALVGLAGHLFSKHRIAVNLAARTVALMGIGFGILATVATFSILQTGLRELQRRHAPIVVDLARRLSPMDSAWTRREVRREINLFRATQREVTAVVTWFDDCMAECLVVASDPTKREVVLAWAETAIGKTRASEVLATARFDGMLNLVVPSAVRDGQGLPNGQVLLIVEADWLADRAFRTALILVAVAYVLLFAVGVLTQWFVGLSVAERVKRLVTHLEMGDPAVLTPASRSYDSDDELGLLDTTIRDHVERSVARVSEADRHVADARAMATRIQSTATLAAGVAHD